MICQNVRKEEGEDVSKGHRDTRDFACDSGVG